MKVYTSGTFDVLTHGHLEFFSRAIYLGDDITVLLNSDSSVKKIKGESRPIYSEGIRKYNLMQLRTVSNVISFNEPTPEKILEDICKGRQIIYVKSTEYVGRLPEQKIVEDNGGIVVFLPRNEAYSTTKLIEQLKGTKK